MTRKNYYIIPVIIAIVIIPQLLFWWLSPNSSEARLTVYLFGTALTIGIPVAFFITYWKSNLRRTAGLSIVSGLLEIAVVILSALLLSLNVSIRSSIFAFIITTLLCLIILIPLIGTTLKEQNQGLYPANFPTEPCDRLVSDDNNRRINEQTLGKRHQTYPVKHNNQVSINKPLPPRNR